MLENCIVRRAIATDQPTLWTMLSIAAHETSLGLVKANPDLKRYVEGWGRTGDIGIVAETEHQAVGAAWLRLWSADDAGYGYLDETIPELAIAVLPNYQNRGIGSRLLLQILEIAQTKFPAVSLSARADNPAVKLYQREGFVPVAGTEVVNRTGGISCTMVRKFEIPKADKQQ